MASEYSQARQSRVVRYDMFWILAVYTTFVLYKIPSQAHTSALLNKSKRATRALKFVCVTRRHRSRSTVDSSRRRYANKSG